MGLALLKKAERVKDKHYVLVIVTGDAVGLEDAIARAVWEAGQFGVSLLTARSYAEAARLLIGIETEHNLFDGGLLDEDIPD